MVGRSPEQPLMRASPRAALGSQDSAHILATVKPVPNWLDARLNTSYKDVYKAKLKGNSQALAKAERELARWQRKLAAYQAGQAF